MSAVLDSALRSVYPDRARACEENDALMSTTRRYPRNLGEAFGGPEYAQAFWAPEPSVIQRIANAIKEWRS